jgi:DNA-binding NtrC family response regulator
LRRRGTHSSAALEETRGNRRRAAEMLGIGERTLYRKIKEYRVPEEEYAMGGVTS